MGIKSLLLLFNMIFATSMVVVASARGSSFGVVNNFGGPSLEAVGAVDAVEAIGAARAHSVGGCAHLAREL